MSISSWLRGSSAALATHRSVDSDQPNSIDFALKELEGSDSRIDRFVKSSGIKNIRRSVAFMGAGVMLATSPVSAGTVEAASEAIQPLDQQGIQQMMSPASMAYHKAAGAENLTIVSQDDTRLNDIVARMEPDLIPDVRPHETRVASPTAEDDVKRDLLTQYFDDRVDKAHVAHTADHEDGERVCFVQDSVPLQIPSDYGLPLVIGDKEMALGVLSHELAHCQDFNNVAFKDEQGNVYDEVRQREVVADLTASLLVSSHTKNWDFVDYSLKPMREINVEHTDHATTHWLSRMRATTDLEALDPLNQKQAFELAQQKYQTMNYSIIQDRNLDDWVLNKGYKKAIEGDLSWNNMPDDFKDYYRDHHGVNNQAELMPALEKHGQSQIKVYLNHVNYKSLEGDEKTATELLSYLGKHAVSFDNQALSTEVTNQKQAYDRDGVIDVVALGHASDVLIDKKAKQRFETNAQKMAEIDRGFYPNEPDAQNEVSTIDPFSEVKKEAEMTNAKERFVDKVKIAEKKHEHSNDSDHEHPG